MINSTGMILDDENFHEDIFEMDYSDSFKKIIDLEGVGPKVADCILLYAYNKHEAYPVDVWINRITTYMYFNGQKVSNKKIMDFAQERFGKYSGYVQLYLFNYARESGLMDKIKSKK
jgi:N-glycosylase/DNA lyase